MLGYKPAQDGFHVENAAQVKKSTYSNCGSYSYVDWSDAAFEVWTYSLKISLVNFPQRSRNG